MISLGKHFSEVETCELQMQSGRSILLDCDSFALLRMSSAKNLASDRREM